jgi:hypothetical protein
MQRGNILSRNQRHHRLQGGKPQIAAIPPQRPWLFLTMSAASAVGLIFVAATPVIAAPRAAYHEGFESDSTSWQASGADAQYRLDRHERTPTDFAAGERSERISITATQGSYVYFAHAVPHARILDELQLSLTLKSDRQRLQLLARVVFPNSLDPNTKRPLTALVRGAQSKDAGIWQRLEITDLPQLVDRQVRVLRAQHGPHVDPRGAYVDQLLVNVYGGPGQTTVCLDELRVEGAVNIDSEVQLAAANADAAQLTGGNPKKSIRLSGSVLNLDGRPFFPRAIEHQGESLSHLAELGFNAVRVNAPPSEYLLAEAEQAGVWLISPPPPLKSWNGAGGETQVEPIPAVYDPVLAWSLGQDLTSRELDAVADLRKKLRAADRRRARPTVGSPETRLLAYSKPLDLVSAYRFPLASTLELADYGNWLRERPRLARPGTPLWTVVQTQPSASLRFQWSAFGGAPRSAPLDSEAIRLLALTAVGAGVRGIEFASHSSLELEDNESRIRALTLALINAELAIVEPWVAAGSYLAAADSNDPQVKGVVLEYDRSRLLIVTRSAQGAQYVPQHVSSGSVSFVVPGVPESHDLIELTPAGLRPLKHRRVTGGTLVTLENFDCASLVLMTPDALMANVLARRLATVSQRSAQLARELAARTLAEVESVDRRLPTRVRDDAASSSLLTAARSSLQRADGELSAGDRRMAYASSRQALTSLGELKRKHFERARDSLRSTVASPFVAAYGTLPEHWALIDNLHARRQDANRLAAGDFESLPALMQAGWRHLQHPQSGVTTTVELAPGDTQNGGRSCLRMEVAAEDPKTAAALLETTPLWITTPPAPIAAGEVVRIEGRVKVPSAIRGSVDGLLVIDSLGGESLAERFGQTNGWEQFVLYRAAPRDANLSITFALTGFGEALIDNVAITPLVPSGAAPRRISPPGSASNSPAAEQALRLQQAFGGPRR